MRSLVVVVLAALLLAGCTSRVGGASDGAVPDGAVPNGAAPDSSDPTAVGPVVLAVPIEVRPVLATASTDPAVIVLPTEDGERLTLAEPILTIRRLDKAEVALDQNSGTWVLVLDLDEADGRTFGDWTTDHTGERLAMVADDEVLMAPQIQGAITGGEIQLGGDYTQDDVKALLGRITGR